MAVDQEPKSESSDPLSVLDAAIECITERKKDTQSEITAFTQFLTSIQDLPVHDPLATPPQDQVAESDPILADILNEYYAIVDSIRNFSDYSGTPKEYFKKQFSDELILALSQSNRLYSPIADQLEKETQSIIRAREELLSDINDELEYIKQTSRTIKENQDEMELPEDPRDIEFAALVDHYEELETRTNEIEDRISERQTMIHERSDMQHEFYYQTHDHDYPILVGLSIHVDSIEERLTELTAIISSRA